MPTLLLLAVILVLVLGGWFLGSIILKRKADFKEQGGHIKKSLANKISKLEGKKERLAERRKELELTEEEAGIAEELARIGKNWQKSSRSLKRLKARQGAIAIERPIWYD